MCLILFAFQHHQDYPLIVCANRDEDYLRPTLAAHHWQDNPQVFGGKDLRAGGTWMGLHHNGRFAAITNYRNNDKPPGDAISRGSLCRDFLYSTLDTEQYLTNIDRDKARYAGFNLLIGTSNQLFYYSNQLGEIIEVKPGIHGLSNGFLNEAWPKVASGKSAMAVQLEKSANTKQLLEILKDTSQADDALLPDTGLDINIERLLSSRFIRTPAYGTRNSTVLRIDRHQHAQWLEQNFDSNGPIADITCQQIALQQPH